MTWGFKYQKRKSRKPHINTDAKILVEYRNKFKGETCQGGTARGAVTVRDLLPGKCLKCWSSKDSNALSEWYSALRGGGNNHRLVKGDLAGGKDPQVVWKLIQDKAYRG